MLADFRAWLEALAREPIKSENAVDDQPPVDLHTLLGQMIALRQEINLQTRAVRAQQEQGGEALRQVGQALALLQNETRSEGDAKDSADAARPLLKALLDVYDALNLAGRESRRVQETLLSGLDVEKAPPFRGLSRWLVGGQLRRYEQEQQARASRVRELLDSMVTGYAMSTRRIERVLQEYQVEPLETVGRPFDPEWMEAVEMVTGSGRSPGDVVDEVRRGYRWRGRLFRYAQVRVAR